MDCIHRPIFFFTANDFSGGDRVLMFSPDIYLSCVMIEIFNDSLIENDEVFNVALVLEVNQTFTMLGNNSFATVTILDSDGGRSEVQVVLFTSYSSGFNPHSVSQILRLAWNRQHIV